MTLDDLIKRQSIEGLGPANRSFDPELIRELFNLIPSDTNGALKNTLDQLNENPIMAILNWLKWQKNNGGGSSSTVFETLTAGSSNWYFALKSDPNFTELRIPNLVAANSIDLDVLPGVTGILWPKLAASFLFINVGGCVNLYSVSLPLFENTASQGVYIYNNPIL